MESKRRSFTDRVFTYASINDSVEAKIEYTPCKNGDVIIHIITDAHTGKNISTAITPVSYRRVVDMAKHLGAQRATPD